MNAIFKYPSQLDVRPGGSQQKLTAHFAFSSIHKLKFDVYHEARQTSQLFSPDRFAAFGKGVQLISGSPYAETEHLSRLTSPSGILATS